MSEPREQMAIIQGVGVGMRDTGRPVLWWSAEVGEGTGALQVFNWNTAYDIIKAYGVREVHSLNGKPCWVEVDGNRIMFKRPCIINREDN